MLTPQPISTTKITELELTKIVTDSQFGVMENQTQSAVEKSAKLLVDFKSLIDDGNGFILTSNAEVIYNHKINALLPNFATTKLNEIPLSQPKPTVKSFAGFQCRRLKIAELKLLFDVGKNIEILRSKFDFFNKESNLNSETLTTVEDGNFTYKLDGKSFGKGTNETALDIPVFPLQPAKVGDLTAILLQLVQHNLIPVDLPDDTKKHFTILCNCYQLNPQALNGLEVNVDVIKNIPEITSLDDNENFDLQSLKDNLIANQPIHEPELAKTKTKAIIDYLLHCDKNRIDLTSYEMKMLTDPNRGHWDLHDLVNAGEYDFQLDQTIVARPPQIDVKTNGFIGIDFGTKSTIVMYQDQSDKVLPIPIGTGNLLGELTSKHYENPTALNFINLEKFISDYNSRTGRPDTVWEDLTTSHTAFSSMVTESTSDSYYSFLYELKQWAGDKNNSIRIQDKKNNYTIVLEKYLNLKEDEFDPIEIYAYFIGLYINNMHNNSGSIYLRYILSYPVTYDVEIREKLVDSFTKGIKKSLPKAILEDDEMMKKFKVQIGASEPVAYAVCAMEQFGFDPCDDEKIYYGVFDFGGGTTDFDFGYFCENDGNSHHDYVVQIGASGDRTLGGENLLELLAFHVFKDNISALKEKGENKGYIPFILPRGTDKTPGVEILVNNSQEAKVNTAKLMEQLRKYWENTESLDVNSNSQVATDDSDDDFDEFEMFEGTSTQNVDGNGAVNTIPLQLLNHEGEPQPRTLKIDINLINKVLYDRIELGVENFFQSMISAFNLPINNDDVKEVNILLAGNSSKSPILLALFNEYIEKYQTIFEEENVDMSESTKFVIYPPLGSDEARKIQAANQVRGVDENSPTGKTGVAYGILKTRSGSKIKLVQNVETNNETKFKYFIGDAKKGLFKPTTSREIEYNKWYKFLDASEEDFTLYYTDSPSANSQNMLISDVKRITPTLAETFSQAFILYRAVSPTEIEITVSEIDETKIDDIKGVDLITPFIVNLDT